LISFNIGKTRSTSEISIYEWNFTAILFWKQNGIYFIRCLFHVKIIKDIAKSTNKQIWIIMNTSWIKILKWIQHLRWIWTIIFHASFHVISIWWQHWNVFLNLCYASIELVQINSIHRIKCPLFSLLCLHSVYCKISLMIQNIQLIWWLVKNKNSQYILVHSNVDIFFKIHYICIYKCICKFS